MRHLLRWCMACAALLAVLVLLVWFYGVWDDVDPASREAGPGHAPEQRARGAYLARAGNCMLCHTARGGAAYAGGRAIETPFGTVFSGNITPDLATGIGNWTPAQFWRAMHHGRSADGRLLVPAFPYDSMTLVSREHTDALFAHLQAQPPVPRQNTAHRLRWPFNTQAALAVWRALYFRPAAFQPDAGRDASWNRGAYLVQGLGHCNACHTTRDALGGADARRALAGGPIPMQNWYAPSLLLASEAGVADWEPAQIVRLLQTGVSAHASATGPMAEVVLHSTQYLSDADLGAMAQFLKSLAPAGLPGAAAVPAARTAGTAQAGVAAQAAGTAQAGAAARAGATAQAGAKLYEKHCVQCHGEQGEGVAGAYPALAGNRAVSMANSTNLVQIVLHGGFAPATRGNPRPFGMPPYQVVLGDAEVAAVLSHIRGSWGNHAGDVSEFEVTRYRAAAVR